MSDPTTTPLVEVVETGPSPTHGTGVFARIPLADGAFIGAYEGEETDVDGTYVLWIEDDEDDENDEDGHWRGVDGTGLLRFLNHSRAPNVEFDGPELYAIRDIAAGEELRFDYGEHWAHVP